MKKFFILMGTFAIISTFLVAGSYSQEVNKVIYLTDQVYNTPAEKFLLKQLKGPDNRGFRVVFVHDGKRYTFDHNWWMDGVQIWVRPNGTSHPNPPANCFADKNMDGIIDFGTDGHSRIFAVTNAYYEGSEAKGLKYKPYWQNIYDEALAGLLITLR